MRSVTCGLSMGLAFFAAAWLLGGCAAGTTDNSNPGSVAQTVTIQNMAFSPLSIKIKAGETVRWSNQDGTVHTVTSGNPGDGNAGSVFDGTVLPGRSFDHTFSATGTFKYFCRIHATMMFDATVTVE